MKEWQNICTVHRLRAHPFDFVYKPVAPLQKAVAVLSRVEANGLEVKITKKRKDDKRNPQLWILDID